MHQSLPETNPILTHNAKQRAEGLIRYQKSDPGGDHYYVGCLGQTRVSLPE